LNEELEREKQEAHDKITDLEVKLQEANLLRNEYQKEAREKMEVGDVKQ
jgi:hypothetical protein